MTTQPPFSAESFIFLIVLAFIILLVKNNQASIFGIKYSMLISSLIMLFSVILVHELHLKFFDISYWITVPLLFIIILITNFIINKII